jgi:hypothetical protein
MEPASGREEILDPVMTHFFSCPGQKREKDAGHRVGIWRWSEPLPEHCAHQPGEAPFQGSKHQEVVCDAKPAKYLSLIQFDEYSLNTTY